MVANKKVLLASFAFLLTACTSPNAPLPATSTATRPVETSLPSPSPLTLSDILKTPEAMPGQTPEPAEAFNGSLAGLIYYDQKGIWEIAQDGEHELIYGFEGEEHNYISISPNLDKIMYPLPGTTGTLITDLSSGETEEMWRYGEFSFCSIDWWEAQPDLLLVGIQYQHTHMACYHIPAIKAWNGSILEVLGNEQVWPGTMAGSPDGTSIAFDHNGIPWMYTLENGKKQFDVSAYGFPFPENAHFYYPSWSTKGTFLSWLVFVGDTKGIAVFDLEKNTSRFLYPYELSVVSLNKVSWGLDDKYLLLRTIHTGPIQAIDVETNEIVYANSDAIIGFAEWSPDGKWIAHSQRDQKYEIISIVVVSIEKAGIYTFPYLMGEVWSSDSDLLLMREVGDEENTSGGLFVLDVSTGKLYQTDLTPDIHILAWAAD